MIERSRHRRLSAFALIAVTLLASPLRAQDASLTSPPGAPVPASVEAMPAASTGPTLSSARVGVRRSATAADAPAPAPRQGQATGTTLMIVGGAAILTGIVIGNGAGYAISVAGAVIGLYGLYQYLQ